VNTGNEAVQLSFMRAHEAHQPCPPQQNIDLFANYARDLVSLFEMDALVVTCSTMNRAISSVRSAVRTMCTERGQQPLPVIQVDEAMMEDAVAIGGTTLVIATHGPTVASTQSLLKETAARSNKDISFVGATIEDAFHLLGQGNIEAHNTLIARCIEDNLKQKRIDSVVLAQLSMAVFAMQYPDPAQTFGIPVLNSGDCGFQEVARVLRAA
jgi:hypothetical protein